MLLFAIPSQARKITVILTYATHTYHHITVTASYQEATMIYKPVIYTNWNGKYCQF